jgi:hypothetical protein
MMEPTGVDRRPGIEVPVKTPIRTSRFAHLARSGPAAKSLLTSSSMVLAAFFVLALLYGYDSYFFEGYYGSATWKLFQQIGGTFAF